MGPIIFLELFKKPGHCVSLNYQYITLLPLDQPPGIIPVFCYKNLTFAEMKKEMVEADGNADLNLGTNGDCQVQGNNIHCARAAPIHTLPHFFKFL